MSTCTAAAVAHRDLRVAHPSLMHHQENEYRGNQQDQQLVAITTARFQLSVRARRPAGGGCVGG